METGRTGEDKHRGEGSKNDRSVEQNQVQDAGYTEGRDQYFMDIDRMVNEGLGGGQVTEHNGLIGDTTTDTMNEREGL